MVRVWLAAAVVFLADEPKQAQPPTGLWMGTLNILGLQKLRLVLDVSEPTPGKVVATVDSIDQGASGIPVNDFTAADGKLKFEMKALKASYVGALKPDGKYHGTFEQAGMKMTLVLERIKERPTPPSREQDPKKPYPYREEEVKVVNEHANRPITLAGTLTLPTGEGPHPAVVLITGSGAQNRNEEIMNHRPFLVLADHLTRKGIAVLRMDDRGVGGSSKGSRDDTSEDFAGDIRAAVEFLGKDKRIDAKRIGLIGHSEGGIIAPMVAAKAPDKVAFIVMLAGTTLTGEEILYLQGAKILRAGGASEGDANANQNSQRRLFKILREEADASKRKQRLMDEMAAGVKKLPGSLRKSVDSEDARKMQAAVLDNGWMRFFLQYDPLPTLRDVHCPVLALWGEKDLQVPPVENIAALKKGIPDWESRKITVTVFPALNHLFQTSVTGSPAEYQQLPETFSPIALEAVSDWIRKQTGVN